MTLRPAQTITISVHAEHAGLRLDKFLAAQLPALSRTRIQELIAEGRVRIHGRAGKPARKIEAGDEIEIEAAARRPLEATPEDIPLKILYEDEDLVVVNKPAGMTVHAGAGISRGTLVNALLGRYQRLSGAGGKERPGIVHRLDKETSGVLVVARNDEVHRALSEQFSKRTVRKTYLALLHGKLSRDSGKIELPIARDTRRRTRMTSRRREGRAAKTSWRVRARLAGFTLVEADLHTGRTHQIRVHFSALGHPVVGDTLYGAARHPQVSGRNGRTTLPPLGRNFLHAARICFEHPRSGQPVEVCAPLPAELHDYLQRLAEQLGEAMAKIDAALSGYL